MRWGALRWAIPFAVVVAAAPLFWRVFGRLWRALEAEPRPDAGLDRRPLVLFAWAAAVLTVIEHHDVRTFRDDVLPWLERLPALQPWLATWQELAGRAFSVTVRVLCYLSPLLFWRRLFPGDRLLDMGLRPRGTLRHAWIYAAFFVVLLPVLTLVARDPAFASYYPKYGEASRSWTDWAAWELLWVAQFFCLEFFFRGFWLYAARSLGAAAIFSMTVPYCMIHFGKPYLETVGAILTGVVLGTLAMWTRSIWGGFAVHASVAVTLDALALH